MRSCLVLLFAVVVFVFFLCYTIGESCGIYLLNNVLENGSLRHGATSKFKVVVQMSMNSNT